MVKEDIPTDDFVEVTGLVGEYTAQASGRVPVRMAFADTKPAAGSKDGVVLAARGEPKKWTTAKDGGGDTKVWLTANNAGATFWYQQ